MANLWRRLARRRISVWLFAGWSCALACFGQTTIVTDDRAFNGVPFEKWLAEGDQSKFHWSAHLTAVELSNHQRLQAKINLQVDGSELAARRGHGYLVMLVQLEDADHRVYRAHGSVDMQQVTEAAVKSDLIYSQEAFLRPGDYQVALAIFDTKTGEHSTQLRKIHANPLKNDPFPSAWDDLPAVEFMGAADPPDSWYLPQASGRLRLPVETRRPVRLEVLVNASPTTAGSGVRTGQVNNRSLVDLLPALKVISQVKLSKGTLRVSLLDLTRQTVLFEQNISEPKPTGDLDWPELRAALVKADPNKIDARSLEHRTRNAQFFIEQVRERLGVVSGRAGESPKEEPLVTAGIVLSGPMAFESGEDRHPIEAPTGFAGKLFYIRYHSLPPLQPQAAFTEPPRNGRRSVGALPAPKQLPEEPLDALENLVKPLQPRLFDVYTPEQFRKAMAAALDEISRM
jgi:hypothetical protein